MPEMTYAQMDKVLSSVGFTVQVETKKKKLRVYEHPEIGARLALAFRPDDETVLPHHLAAIQGTLKVYGIADPLGFAAQPQKASGQEGRRDHLVEYLLGVEILEIWTHSFRYPRLKVRVYGSARPGRLLRRVMSPR